MAMRQYIGARYVPRFLGPYDNTQEYEALDVVDNGSGTSYIARKIVPAGTPLTDTEYWFVYGASSGAIIALQNRMDSAENRLDTDEGDIADNAADIAMMKTKKIIMICDSYGTRMNAGGKTVADILRDRGFDVAYDIAIAGASFADTTPNQRFDNHINDYTGDASKITDVLFCGGVNDREYTFSNIVSAVASTISDARTKYPNARIHVVPWGVCFSNNITNAENMYKIVPYAYCQGCANAGGLIAANAEYMLRNSELLESDLVHPNSDGVDFIAGQLDCYLRGAVIDVYHCIECSATLYDTSYTAVELKDVIMRRHNGNVTIMTKTSGWGPVRVTFPAAHGFIDANPLFYYDKTLFSHRNSGQFVMSMRGIALNTSNKYVGASGKINIYANGYCRFVIVPDEFTDDITSFDAIDNTITIND